MEDEWNCPCGVPNSVLASQCFICDADRPDDAVSVRWAPSGAGHASFSTHSGAGSRPSGTGTSTAGTTGTAGTGTGTGTDTFGSAGAGAGGLGASTKHGTGGVGVVAAVGDSHEDDWVCGCGVSNSALAGDCFVCETPRGSAVPVPVEIPTEAPELERLPSEIEPDFFVPTPEEAAAWATLSPGQQAALQRVTCAAKKESDEAMDPLLSRVTARGFSRKDLLTTLKYIRDEAPIVVHVNLSKVLKFFLKDPVYRNQFETQSSGGSLNHDMRTKKEDRMFFSYYAGLDAPRRVKYGVLNPTNDPKGVTSCHSYGTSHFIMKNVRLRTTFSDQNSCSERSKIGTCEYYAHVLMQYSDEELERVLKVATGALKWTTSKLSSGKYKELQIHGTIHFAEHVKYLSVSESDRSSVGEREILEFAAKNGFSIIWQGSAFPESDTFEMHWPIVNASAAKETLRGTHGVDLESKTDDAEPPPVPRAERTLVGTHDVPWYAHGAYVPSPPFIEANLARARK